MHIWHAIQGQARSRICKEADKVSHELSGVSQGFEQKVPRESQTRPMEGRARAAAIYPQELCRTICRATLEQAKADAGDLMCIKCVDTGDDDHVGQIAFEKP